MQFGGNLEAIFWLECKKRGWVCTQWPFATGSHLVLLNKGLIWFC